MIRILIGILLLVLLLSTPCADAGYPTGKDLLIGCTGAYEDPVTASTSPIHCIGYIDGIIDAHALISSANPKAKYFCSPPGGLSAGDALDAVILYIQNTPGARSMTGRVVVIKALQEKYPCK